MPVARLPRLYLPGCAQHVIQRGNNREACSLLLAALVDPRAG